MSKSLIPLLSTGAGVVAAGAVGFFIVEGTSFTPETTTVEQAQERVVETSPQESILDKPIVVPKPKSVENQAQSTESEASELASLDQKVVEKPAGPKLPEFDILRVERDGSAVIAGTAEANSEIELVDAANGNKVLGRAKALPSGEYAIVLEERLEPGKHELYIVSQLKGGGKVQSIDSGLIEIPEPDSDTSPIVIVANPKKPTRILQNPELDIAVATLSQDPIVSLTQNQDSPEPSSQDASSDAGQETITETAPIVSDDTQGAEQVASIEAPLSEQQANSTQVETPVETSEQTKPDSSSDLKSIQPVLIEAADVEQNKIFIAGVGEPGAKINMYLDEKFIGSAQVAENGAFLFEGDISLKPGRYPVRADVLKGNSTKVLARAQVSLVHQPKVDIAQAAEIVEQKQADEPQATKQELAAEQVKPAQEEVEPNSEPLQSAAQQIDSAAASVKVSKEALTKQTNDSAEQSDTEAENTADTNIELAEIRTGASVIIRRGDNLWVVARRNYGQGLRFTTIFDANRDQVRNPNLIYPGQVLKIPENEQDQ